MNDELCSALAELVAYRQVYAVLQATRAMSATGHDPESPLKALGNAVAAVSAALADYARRPSLASPVVEAPAKVVAEPTPAPKKKWRHGEDRGLGFCTCGRVRTFRGGDIGHPGPCRGSPGAAAATERLRIIRERAAGRVAPHDTVSASTGPDGAYGGQGNSAGSGLSASAVQVATVLAPAPA